MKEFTSWVLEENGSDRLMFEDKNFERSLEEMKAKGMLIKK